MSSDPAAHQSRHPTLKQYVAIAIFLFVVTLVEFVIILPEDFRGAGWTIAPLAILSAIKFAAVIFFYMHLKFDNRLLTWIFLGGLALGFAVVFALVALQDGWQPSPGPWAQANAEPCLFDHEHGGCLEPTPTPVPPTPTPDPNATPTPTPDLTVLSGVDLVAEGRNIFITGQGQGAATACATCHIIESVPESYGLLGPDLSHIATDAATRQPGVSARDYITTSIVDPESFVAEGVDRATPGLMTSVITASLTDADVEALVEFLMQQE